MMCTPLDFLTYKGLGCQKTPSKHLILAQSYFTPASSAGLKLSKCLSLNSTMLCMTHVYHFLYMEREIKYPIIYHAATLMMHQVFFHPLCLNSTLFICLCQRAHSQDGHWCAMIFLSLSAYAHFG